MEIRKGLLMVIQTATQMGLPKEKRLVKPKLMDSVMATQMEILTLKEIGMAKRKVKPKDL